MSDGYEVTSARVVEGGPQSRQKGLLTKLSATERLIGLTSGGDPSKCMRAI